MKSRLISYVFNPTAKTIAFPSSTTLTLDGFLLITNTTSNVIIYNFSDSTLGATLAYNILTLTYNTAAMASTDALQIWYDDGLPNTVPTNATVEAGGNLEVSVVLLRQMLQELRINNALLQSGLNVKDDLDLMRRDSYYNTYQ